jgi:phosphoserine phosphatase
VAGVVGTDIEIKDGYFTGRVIPPACMGVEKDRQTRRFLQARGWSIDLASSFAYADSISDRALLEMVGHSIAVYPDPALAALARQQNWDIMPHA